jgi:hypothetical protein
MSIEKCMDFQILQGGYKFLALFRSAAVHKQETIAGRERNGIAAAGIQHRDLVGQTDNAVARRRLSP